MAQNQDLFSPESIIDNHRIDQQTYNNGIQDFFGGATPPPLSNTWGALQAQLARITDPAGWYLQLSADRSNHSDNNDIQFQIVQEIETGDLIVNYSVLLIRTLAVTYSPNDFTFTKATQPGGASDIFFQVVRGGGVVYLGDKSNTLP